LSSSSWSSWRARTDSCVGRHCETLAQSSDLSRARVALSHEVPRRPTPHHRRQ
jgi:hypothetical protein